MTLSSNHVLAWYKTKPHTWLTREERETLWECKLCTRVPASTWVAICKSGIDVEFVVVSLNLPNWFKSRRPAPFRRGPFIPSILRPTDFLRSARLGGAEYYACKTPLLNPLTLVPCVDVISACNTPPLLKKPSRIPGRLCGGGIHPRAFIVHERRHSPLHMKGIVF